MNLFTDGKWVQGRQRGQSKPQWRWVTTVGREPVANTDLSRIQS